MNTYCLLTVSVGDVFKDLSKITYPFMIEYCLSHNIDYVCLTTKHEHVSPAWTRLECEKLLKYYDYVLYCDSDVLIKKNSPNIFSIIENRESSDIFAPFVHNYSGSGMRMKGPFNNTIDKYCRYAKLPSTEGSINFYVCSGCVVYTKGFLKYFNEPKLPEVDVNYRDQEALNYAIYSGRITCSEIPEGFGNYFDENSYKDSTYFVHFCDQGAVGREKIINMFLSGCSYSEIKEYKRKNKTKRLYSM